MHKRRNLLYFEQGLSMSQIAEIEGCSKMAIKYSIKHPDSFMDIYCRIFQNKCKFKNLFFIKIKKFLTIFIPCNTMCKNT